MKKWFPQLAAKDLEDPAPPPPVTQLSELVDGADGPRRALEADALSFASWLKTRRGRCVWVCTHQGPAEELLRLLCGGGYAESMTNARIVIFRLPGVSS